MTLSSDIFVNGKLFLSFIVSFIYCILHYRLGENWAKYCYGQNPNGNMEKLNEMSNQEISSDNVDINSQQSKEYEFIAPSRYIFKGAELNEAFDSDSNDDSDEDEIQNVDYEAESFVDDDTNDEISVSNRSQDMRMMVDNEQSLVMMNESNSGTSSNELSTDKDNQDVMKMVQSPESATNLMMPSINDESMMMATDET